jgi:hypothetical protein
MKADQAAFEAGQLAERMGHFRGRLLRARRKFIGQTLWSSFGSSSGTHSNFPLNGFKRDFMPWSAVFGSGSDVDISPVDGLIFAPSGKRSSASTIFFPCAKIRSRAPSSVHVIASDGREGVSSPAAACDRTVQIHAEIGAQAATQHVSRLCAPPPLQLRSNCVCDALSRASLRQRKVANGSSFALPRSCQSK